MKAKHVSFNYFAKNTGYTYRGFCSAKQNKSIPPADKVLMMSDVLNISLDELCDPRIPVSDVVIDDPYPIYPGYENRFTDELILAYRKLSLKDTRMIMQGSGVEIPEE